MANTVSRLTANGNLFITGQFDEVTFDPNANYPKNLISNSQIQSSGYYPYWPNNWALNTGYGIYNTPATLSPDGTQTAFKLATLNTGSATTQRAYYTPQTLAGTIYTFSVYLKSAEYRYMQLYLEDTGIESSTNPVGGRVGITVDLLTGTYINTVFGGSIPLISYNIQPYGNGWYRYSWTVKAYSTTSASITNFIFYRILDNNQNGGIFGDNFSGIYMWGPQMEIGPVATDYEATSFNSLIPTVNTASRLDSSGNMFVKNIFDEVTFDVTAGYNKNIYKSSSNLTNIAYWNPLGAGNVVSSYATTAPDNTYTAAKLIPRAGLSPTSPSSEVLPQSTGYGVMTVGLTYTQSIYFKNAEFNGLGIRDNNSGQVYQFFPGTTPTTSNNVLNPQLLSVGNGWYRASWSFIARDIAGGGARSDNWSFRCTQTGDGASGIYIWGPQLELGSSVTIYEATVGASGSVKPPPLAGPPSRLDNLGNFYVSGILDETSNILPVIDSSLTFYVDFGIPESYSGSGTTVYDLSPNKFVGSILVGSQQASGPVFSPTVQNSFYWAGNNYNLGGPYLNNGQIKFTNATINNLGMWQSDFTYSCWVNSTTAAVNARYVESMIGCEGTPANGGQFSVWFNNGTIQVGMYGFSANYNASSLAGTWMNITATYTYKTATFNLYVNGTYVSQQSNVGVFIPAIQNTGIELGYAGYGAGYLHGYLANTMIYNRLLTPAEISTNFNGMRNRFGV